jgi:hypothetical protein
MENWYWKIAIQVYLLGPMMFHWLSLSFYFFELFYFLKQGNRDIYTQQLGNENVGDYASKKTTLIQSSYKTHDLFRNISLSQKTTFIAVLAATKHMTFFVIFHTRA